MLQALLTASEKGSPYRNISDRAVGVVFLGVPAQRLQQITAQSGIGLGYSIQAGWIEGRLAGSRERIARAR